MPSWKKIIQSGSYGELSRLFVRTSVTASIFSGSFIGNGTNLSGITKGPENSIQFRDGNINSGSSYFIYDKTNHNVHLTGSLYITGSAFVESDISFGIKEHQAILSTGVITSSVAVSNNVVKQIATASCDSAFFEYVVKKDNNLRAGLIMSVWNSIGDVTYSEMTTNHIGDTNHVSMSVDLTNGNVRLKSNAESSGWFIKAIARTL